MTRLCEMIMECRAIDIDDRVILYGWASQLEEGNDLLYCSKETVAAFLGTSIDTVKRRTKRLTGGGFLVATGERKQWPDGSYTPVYQINVPMIAGIIASFLCNLTPRAKCTPVQIARQGSEVLGSMVLGLICSNSSSRSDSEVSGSGNPASLPPKAWGENGKETENLEPKTLEPKAEPQPTPEPNPLGQNSGVTSKHCCKDCGQPLQRNVNHFLDCAYAKGRSDLPEYEYDSIPMDKLKDFYGDGAMAASDGLDDDEPLFPSGLEASKRGEAVGQKNGENRGAEGRASPTPTTFAPAPRSAAPPSIPCKGKSKCGSSVYAKYEHDETTGWRNGWCPKCVENGLSVEITPPASVVETGANL